MPGAECQEPDISHFSGSEGFVGSSEASGRGGGGGIDSSWLLKTPDRQESTRMRLKV